MFKAISFIHEEKVGRMAKNKKRTKNQIEKSKQVEKSNKGREKQQKTTVEKSKTSDRTSAKRTWLLWGLTTAISIFALVVAVFTLLTMKDVAYSADSIALDSSATHFEIGAVSVRCSMDERGEARVGFKPGKTHTIVVDVDFEIEVLTGRIQYLYLISQNLRRYYFDRLNTETISSRDGRVPFSQKDINIDAVSFPGGGENEKGGIIYVMAIGVDGRKEVKAISFEGNVAFQNVGQGHLGMYRGAGEFSSEVIMLPTFTRAPFPYSSLEDAVKKYEDEGIRAFYLEQYEPFYSEAQRQNFILEKIKVDMEYIRARFNNFCLN